MARSNGSNRHSDGMPSRRGYGHGSGRRAGADFNISCRLWQYHVSENTTALATTPASGSTPTGAGTTGYQWFYTSWNYFVGYESLEEALRSDGTPFVTVTDAQIAAGQLLNSNGTPRYPIVISLASEAINNNGSPPSPPMSTREASCSSAPPPLRATRVALPWVILPWLTSWASRWWVQGL